jgi:hypothetical protein
MFTIIMTTQAERERRQLAQREANARAAERGEALPFPNVWDALDATKVPPSASVEQRLASVREFHRLCHPRPKRRHSI